MLALVVVIVEESHVFEADLLVERDRLVVVGSHFEIDVAHALFLQLVDRAGQQQLADALALAGGVDGERVDAAGAVAAMLADERDDPAGDVPGLYLVGEMLDCDGRIGGFNFQWAWSTGFIAGNGAAK